MRFNSLPQSAQSSVAQAVVNLVARAPDDLFLPILPASEWLAAFRKLNIKLDREHLPSSAALFRVVEYLESQLASPNKCLECGNNF